MSEEQAKKKILPDEPVKALNTLVEISDKLAELLEEETNAMAMNDSMKFIVTEEEKFRISQRYDDAANEFQGRKAEFRGIDGTLLDKLEASQDRLKKAAQANVRILEKYKKDVKQDEGE